MSGGDACCHHIRSHMRQQRWTNIVCSRQMDYYEILYDSIGFGELLLFFQ